MKQWLKGIVERTNSPYGKVFALTIQILIVFSIVTFSIETLPNLAQPTKELLRVFEVVTVSVFTVEYLARLYVAD
jgi:voltage-gated potassium channel